mmetsp:Transcript_28776/g.44725  ORF Transcript_28776/g.44725 Transcript_28776/m.44725 type:complete len:90 (+) Transcript_28776:131-400(+)|eukprot:CAMPEP_0196812666 /NCGR_PEP_ID=MMETSP1362-20130617/29227_1 /TAXON_ID=163516 /ORGANISM="Leptocylindrus danicus, Strain CCMP1856" /LENGTH=89 /DNA_ID=CAMNT_0042188457 /DNA_START=93 /DNA_END=362 /DNA_ORIENTATION=+
MSADTVAVNGEQTQEMIDQEEAMISDLERQLEEALAELRASRENEAALAAQISSLEIRFEEMVRKSTQRINELKRALEFLEHQKQQIKQ